ncbi:hypothetical protein SKA34_05165 [Photobacterium sp. SKA34]|uniref:hypothetical protein n=1 Tax=Photobacterium sp. SKA34 TaxID=121723 RepID=UPI00006BA354|nr:hypothetical protein [Photobacterium sp. SKA34]EAR56843.1 hypothetical protein SKA34_05165 [Photobacterium sp. SKA34]
MGVLYKYMKKEHAKLLVEQGSLRIGTLYEFRDEEKHGQEIGDNKEGTKSTYMGVDQACWSTANQPEFTKSFFKLEEDATLNISGLTLEKPQTSPDFYIYCTTYEFDESAMRDFGYDSCVAIEQPENFLKCISKSLKHKGLYQGSYKCKYQSRRMPHDFDSGVHPALIKENEYSYQKEVRSIWLSTKDNIQPIIIKSKKIKKYCRIISCL